MLDWCEEAPAWHLSWCEGTTQCNAPSLGQKPTPDLHPPQAVGRGAKPRLPPQKHPPHLTLSFPWPFGAGSPAPSILLGGTEGPPRGDPLPAPPHPPFLGAKARPLSRARSPPQQTSMPLCRAPGAPSSPFTPRDPPSRYPPVPPGARYLGAGPPAALSPPPPSGLPGAGSAAAGWAARAVPHRYKRKPSPGGRKKRKRRLRHLHRARLGRPAPARC